jgi:hypothetical protein
MSSPSKVHRHSGLRRSDLVALKARILSADPRREVDRAIFSSLDPLGSDEFLDVTQVMTFKVKGQADYEEQAEVVLCSTNDSIGSIALSGETVYWGGKNPDFRDEWRAIPRYTTDFDAALHLKTSILGFGMTIAIEETEVCSAGEDGATQVSQSFRARVRHADGRTVDGPNCFHAASAVLTAMLDDCLAFNDDEFSDEDAP